MEKCAVDQIAIVLSPLLKQMRDFGGRPRRTVGLSAAAPLHAVQHAPIKDACDRPGRVDSNDWITHHSKQSGHIGSIDSESKFGAI